MLTRVTCNISSMDSIKQGVIYLYKMKINCPRPFQRNSDTLVLYLHCMTSLPEATNPGVMNSTTLVLHVVFTLHNPIYSAPKQTGRGKKTRGP